MAPSSPENGRAARPIGVDYNIASNFHSCPLRPCFSCTFGLREPQQTVERGQLVHSQAAKIKGSRTENLVMAARPHGNLISRLCQNPIGIPEILLPMRLSRSRGRLPGQMRAPAAGEVGLINQAGDRRGWMGYRGSHQGALLIPTTNIKYAMKYLAMAPKLGDGSTCGTILKYNAGHHAKRMNHCLQALLRKGRAR